MKKISILIVLLAIYSHVFANLTQSNWRWRNDNGSETAATWKAPPNAPITITSSNEILRLRLQVYCNVIVASTSDVLQYATSPAGPWTTVNTTEGSNAFVIANTSSHVVQAEPTTLQLAGFESYDFVPGKIMLDSMELKNFDIEAGRRTEFEWVIRSTENIVLNTTYYFREWGTTTGKNLLVTYPSLVTAGVLPIKFSDFTVSREDKKIKLKWSATSEQNNDRFEIQRSNDSKAWQTIATVKGHGAAIGSDTYQLYDESPLDGINYYLVKQYGIDGRAYQSDIRSLKMLSDARRSVLISPNPSHSGINFTLTNQGARNVEVILTNVNGSIIHHEIIKNVQANEIYKLNLSHQPARGVYFLRLKGEGLSKSARIVIE